MTGIRVRDTYAVSLTTQVEPDVDMYVLATHDVAFHEPPALMGNVLETLTGINNFIEGGVVPTIQSLMT
jgi:hypothetical protein